ncbi:hypothetical protein SELMODRAFT_431562 [Selaginella moellendorffii]|uniref:Uncharacterized protein n=1 Tax=Selaginella moellendorffii TaxID=88036 RepID=D8TD23_SELML|nr:hypothetical protein SELMODRAFT_431562 [Selaginella moellendorffii]
MLNLLYIRRVPYLSSVVNETLRLAKMSPMVFRRALLDLEFNRGLPWIQQQSFLLNRMKLKDEKILKGRLAKSLEDMHSFYDHGPNVENSSIIKKSCSLAFNLSHFWHKTISNAMHQELAGNYDLQNFQEGMRFTVITASNYQEVVQAQCSSLEGFPGLKGNAMLLVVGIRV